MGQSAINGTNSGNGFPSDPRYAAVGGASKRAVDLIGAALALLLLTPIFIVTCLLVRFLIGKPAIVIEKCLGLGGQTFSQYKFRTTSFGGAAPAHGQRMREVWGECLGEALSVTGIDKVPLLYNVVRGDMSFVGPDLIEVESARVPDTNGSEVLLARPGVTGIHHHVPRNLRAQMAEIAPDRLYVRHWSMWLDLRIACGALTRIHTRDAIAPTR